MKTTEEQITRERIANLNEIQTKAPDLVIRWLAHEKLKKELEIWYNEKYKQPKEL